MPFCKNCGRGLPLDADFCSSCGTRVEKEEPSVNQQSEASYEHVNYGSGAEQSYSDANNGQQGYTYAQYDGAPPSAPFNSEEQAAANRQKVIDNLYLRLKWERIAWSISSKVMIILGAILMGLTFFMFVCGAALGGEDAAYMIAFSFYYGFFASAILAIGIINKIMVGKVQRYMDGLYTDCGPAVTRCESIGMIIFEYFFNNIALVFFIINFIHVKTHKKELEEIRRLQLNANQQNANVYCQ